MPQWDIEGIVEACIAVQQIPAPTGSEARRAEWVAARLRNAGFDEVRVDDTPNVYARIPGSGDGPGIMLSAHTDTVFPADTDLTVRREGSRVYGPGIGDNSLGVAALLALGRRLIEEGESPARDVWLVANAAEEGMGDLRGMRVALDRLGDRIGACIVLEGTASEAWLITHRALGARRYRVWAEGPGGHSWGDYGTPSAIHQLARIASHLADRPIPDAPRSSFNIGVIRGGTSINSIAERAEMLIDLRSQDAPTLDGLAARLEADVIDGTASSEEIDVGFELVGDRPAGEIGREHPLVRAAHDTLAGLGVDPSEIALNRSSTDANIPLSRGIPAVTLYLAQGGDAHRIGEWLCVERLPTGMEWAWRTLRWTIENLDDLQGE